MITRIGLFAGDIWNHLEENARTDTFDNIVSALGAEDVRELVLMSVGWLAREGHITISGSPPNFNISLAERIDDKPRAGKE